MACAEWCSSESPHEAAEAVLLCFKWQHFQCLCFKIMVPISRLIYQLETATDFFKIGFSLLDTFPGFTLILLYSQSHRDVYWRFPHMILLSRFQNSHLSGAKKNSDIRDQRQHTRCPGTLSWSHGKKYMQGDTYMSPHTGRHRCMKVRLGQCFPQWRDKMSGSKPVGLGTGWDVKLLRNLL